MSEAPPERCPESLAKSAVTSAVDDAGTVARDLRSRQVRAESKSVYSAAAFVDRPWLTCEQNASRGALEGRLSELRERADLSPEVQERFDAAFAHLRDVERDLLRIKDWQALMKTRFLREPEWCELGDRVDRVRSSQHTNLDEAAALRKLMQAPPALNSQAQALCGDLLLQLVLVQEYIGSGNAPWQDLLLRVEVPLPADTDATAVVENRGIPGDALARCFAAGYRWNEGDSVVEKALYGHVPELAATSVVNSHGNALFVGLRVGLTRLPGLREAPLWQASDRAIRALGELLNGDPERVAERFDSSSPVSGERSIETLRKRLWRDSWFALTAAVRLESFAEKRMAAQAAAAAMSIDPEKMQRVLGGNQVDVRLFDISLINRADYQHWAEHFRTCQGLEHRPNVSLKLNDAGGGQVTASAKVAYRGFVLCVDDPEAGYDLLPESESSVARLLGGLQWPEVGGEVGARVCVLRFAAEQAAKNHASQVYNHGRTLPAQAMERSSNLRARDGVATLKADVSSLERDALALEQAGQQLKDVWREQGGWPTGEAAYRVAARLALVAFHMDETPMLSCLSGTDFNRRLQAESKWLATIADGEDGHLPPMGLDMARWEDVLDALTVG